MGIVDGQIQARIAARHRMTDPVTFPGIEEQHLIGLGNCIIAADMAHINAAIGEDQARISCAFLLGPVAAGTTANHVLDREDRRAEESPNLDLFHFTALRSERLLQERHRHTR